MFKKSPPMAAFVLLLILALAVLGVGYGLWSKILYIDGTVNTGNVNARFRQPFTDDDNQPDEFDPYDDGDCTDGGLGEEFEGPVGGSCDPKESGAEIDQDHRFTKGVANCVARLAADDPDDEQAGNQGAEVTLNNAYPLYHCNAWFPIRNNGTIPVLLHSISINGGPAKLCQDGDKRYDLDGNDGFDVKICVSNMPDAQEEVQIDPGEDFTFDLDIEVLQDAPQESLEELVFDAQICLHQWNEEGNCPP